MQRHCVHCPDISSVSVPSSRQNIRPDNNGPVPFRRRHVTATRSVPIRSDSTGRGTIPPGQADSETCQPISNVDGIISLFASNFSSDTSMALRSHRFGGVIGFVAAIWLFHIHICRASNGGASAVRASRSDGVRPTTNSVYDSPAVNQCSRASRGSTCSARRARRKQARPLRDVQRNRWLKTGDKRKKQQGPREC